MKTRQDSCFAHGPKMDIFLPKGNSKHQLNIITVPLHVPHAHNKGIFHPSIFDEILFVAEVGFSLPRSNDWPEWGGSVINITKTVCNHLNNETLNSKSKSLLTIQKLTNSVILSNQRWETGKQKQRKRRKKQLSNPSPKTIWKHQIHK